MVNVVKKLWFHPHFCPFYQCCLVVVAVVMKMVVHDGVVVVVAVVAVHLQEKNVDHCGDVSVSRSIRE